MLVLSRQQTEEIVIDGVRIFVVRIRGDKVRIGVHAPSDMVVHRREIEENLIAKLRDEGKDLTQALPRVPYPGGILETGTTLVLSRKRNESIVINHEVTVVVIEIRPDKVRLGVEAPKEIPIHRREVFEAIQRLDHPKPPQTS